MATSPSRSTGLRLLLGLFVLTSLLAVPIAAEEPVGAQAGPAGSGYWMLEASGEVHAFGAAADFGDTVGRGGIDIEASPSGNGYWVLTAAATVEAFGDVRVYGQPSIPTGDRAAALSATPSGRGYWVFTDQGRAFAFGDAQHYGDMAGVPLNGPIAESQSTPTGLGYYMVGTDGGIFSFGDASFHGSMGGVKLNQPVVGIAPTASNGGYWLVAADGGVFSFGDATFEGSMGGTPLNQPVNGIVATGSAYLMVAGDGGIFSFTDSGFHGSLGGNPPPTPVVSVAPMVPGPPIIDDGGETGSGGVDITAGLNAWPAVAADSDVHTATLTPPPPPAGFRSCTAGRRVQVRTPEDLVLLNPANPVLWPGALVQGASYSSPASAQIQELDIDDRAPMNLRVNLLRDNNATVVGRPNGNSVGSAVGRLIDDAQRSGFEPGFETMRFEMRENYSLEQTAFHLGIDARYLGGSVKADLDTRGETETFTVTAFFLEEAFTVTADLPNDPSELFTNAFTQADLDSLRRSGRIGPDNQPIFVQQVTYGRVLTYSVTSTRSVDEIRGAIRAHYGTRKGGATIEMTAAQKQIMREGSLEVSAIGGPRSAVAGVLAGGDLSDYFVENVPLTSYQPVAYTLVQIDPAAIGTPAQVSQTTEYEAVECTAKTKVGTRYRITGQSMRLLSKDCDPDGIFEGNADLIYNFSVWTGDYVQFGPFQVPNMRPIINRAEATTVRTGALINLNSRLDRNTPVEIVIRDGKTPFVEVSGSVSDQDGGLNGDDLYGTLKVRLWSPPASSSSVARSLVADFGENGCSIRFSATITNLGDVFE